MKLEITALGVSLKHCCTVVKTEELALKFPELLIQHSSDDCGVVLKETHTGSKLSWLPQGRQVEGKAGREVAFLFLT